MANLKQSGTRISQYQTAKVNTNEQKDKLLLNHFLISYAPAYYGIGTVNKNFKVPVQSLRDDFKGYIGLVNAKGDWRDSIRFWSGNWSDADRTNSYIYKWDITLRGEYDYISNKFDVEQGIDKIFLLKTAPWPLEAEQADPAPESNKFVNKKYIDDRFNGIRKVKTSNATLQIRPYPCVYEYSTMPSSINIVDTLTLEDGRKIKDCIEKNCLIFYIKLPIPTSTTLSVKANNVDTKWGFSGELTQLLSTAKKNADSGLIKCYAEYINGTFTVHCTNGMNLKPGEGGTVEIDTTDTIVDGSDAVPTSNAVHDFVKEEIKPKLEEVVAGDTFIEVKNKNEVFVNTSSIIFNDDTTVPTTKAVHDSLESLIIESQYNDFVFDLSNLFYEQINNQWCELMVTLSVNEIEIPYREKYYTNVGSLTISGITAESNPSSPSVTTTGFELESFVIDAIKTKLMNVAKTGNQTDLNNVIANYQNDIPYKAAWVRDAKALNIPTQLAFRHSSYRTNEILRMFFYYLDQEYGKTWGADDAYSKKFMVPGLTYKCLTRPDTTFPTEQYYSYVYNIWLGDRGDTDRTMIAWNFKPSYLAIGSYPNESHGANWDGDSFTMPINWDTLVNEQAWDSFLVDYDTFKTTTVPHVANKEIHLTPEEKAQLFKTKFVVTSKPDLTGSQSSGAVGGFVLEPTSDVKTDKIVMKGISGLVSNILYIWKDTADGIVTVLQNPTKSIVDGTTHTWNFNETLTFNANERYYFTWHNAVNSNAIAPSARPERGHTPSVQKYSHVQGQIFALKTTQFFTSADVDRNNTVDCTFYVIDCIETVSPSTESVELKINSHASDTVKHITADERTTWNSITTHASDETKHFIGDEKSMLLKDRFDITKKSNISGTQASETIAGIAIEPTSTFTTDRIVMGGITDLPSCVLYIWKNTDTGVITVLQTPNANKSVIEGDTHTWNLGEVVTFEENNTYFITWQAQQNSNAWAPPATAEQGYVKSTKKYATQTGEHIFVLKVAEVGYNQPRHFGVDQIDRNYTIDCTFYLKNGKEPVAPSPESVQTIANDVKTIKSELTALQNTVKHDIEFVQETMSFGESNINQNSDSNCYGITFIAQENATIDTLTIKTANSGYFSKVENLYAIIHEEQEDGTKKEIASMETPVNLSSSNTQYKLTFYPFAITKDKKYFVEFIQKNTETGSFNDTRTQVNLGLLNDASASGVLSQSSRSSWSVNYANQYSPILKLSQEMFIMGNLALSNDMQYPLSLVAKMNGEDATNIVLLKPFVTASTDINIESVTNGHVLGIILEKNENTVAGEHYLGIKTLYINKETNEMKEVLLHSPLTIIE